MSIEKRKIVLPGLFVLLLVWGCNNQQQSKPSEKINTPIDVIDTTASDPVNSAIQVKPPLSITFHFVKTTEWINSPDFSDFAKLRIVAAVNRTDSTHLVHMDSVIVPNDLSGNLPAYLPFPLAVPYLDAVEKIIFFSYPSQTFAAYEHGVQVYTGPVNMGRKSKPTPEGIYYTNWKARHTVSTVNDEWDLYWNFNIQNRQGIGWHQYSLPGYPASHSCLRLQEADARYLYKWANQWTLSSNDTIVLKGTPVIVFGKYPFGKRRPWWLLVNNADTLQIAPNELQELVAPHYDEIIYWQSKRDSVAAN